MLPGGLSAAGELSAVAHPDESFPKENTVVWTPLFQAAWDRMNHDMGGKPVKIEPPNELMAKLDGFEWSAAEVMPPPERWRVWSGPPSPDFVEVANQEAAQILGEDKGPFDAIGEGDHPPGSRLVLALLDRDLNFPKTFVRSTSSQLAFRNAGGAEAKVEFFGVLGQMSASYSDSVRILHRDEASHAVQLSSDQQDAVVVYLPKEQESFAAAVAKLKGWREEGLKGAAGSALDPALHRGDDLRIPVVEFSQLTDFTPVLQGGRFYSERGVPMGLFKAQQTVDFQMSEKGAKARATAEVGAEPFGEVPRAPVRIVPRKFIFDRPFFVFMWKDAAPLPYMGVWVGGEKGLKVAK